ncbi:MAG TPA: glycosyltransferase, partial [Desulfurococcaceae archaeon]|nr:glycosyltransferase [Desulfurococcaceae archaeon]
MDETKVLVLAELYWPQGGGAELATHLILKKLQKTGKFQITVLTGVKNVEKVDGIKYIYTPHLKPRPKPLLWLFVDYMCRTKYFRKLLKEHDVVYIPRIAYPAIPHVKKSGKVVVHLHNYQPVTYHSVYSSIDENLNNPIKFEELEHQSIMRSIAVGFLRGINNLVKYWLLQADKIVCVSRKQKEILVKHIPELAKKVEVISNPPPEVPSIEKIVQNPPVFLYASGDSYVKGFTMVLRAIFALEKRRTRAKFILIGKYSDKTLAILNKLHSMIKYVEVKYKGRMEHTELLKLHREAWGLLFPSILEEPLPYTVIESMVARTLPIASKVGGVPEIVEGTKAEEYMF